MPHTASSRNESAKLKSAIIALFNKKVRGKIPDTSSSNQGHDGKQGHWLEKQMGIAHNRKTAPDLYGFEMKNQAGSKVTFGDWSPDYKIFNDPTFNISRDQFLKIFGKLNPLKKMRYSWSGSPCPKIGSYNSYGQILEIESNGSIVALYNFTKDQRLDKKKIIPPFLQKNRLVLARWEVESMKKRVEKKFNTRGWFQCRKDEKGKYNEIVFGKPINFNQWLNGVKKGEVYFDSGMYQGNNRPYSQWRANNSYWDSLIVSRHRLSD